jgi:hypothetical protein
MKKQHFVHSSLFVAFAIAFCAIVHSCTPETYFNENDIIGYWANGSDNYRYDINHRGENWDTSDDVEEGEGLKFSWSIGDINESDLTLIFHMDSIIGGEVPKYYTLITLNSTTLSYKDKFGNVHSNSKQH